MHGVVEDRVRLGDERPDLLDLFSNPGVGLFESHLQTVSQSFERAERLPNLMREMTHHLGCVGFHGVFLDSNGS
jgi:hypothetical protein